MRTLALLLAFAAVAPAAEPVEDWKSILDAPKDKVEWAPTDGLRVATPQHFFDGMVTFADQGGPFAVVGRNGGKVANKDEYRIAVDLRTGKTLGKITDTFDNLGQNGLTALSPDGKRFAVVTGRRNKPQAVALYDTATGKDEGDLAVTGEVDALQFAGERLLVSTKTASDVYDVKTRKAILSVDHQRSAWGGAKSTLTPTGKFLIETTGTGFRFYDVETSKSLFKMESPRQDKDKGTNADGVAVSPDGKRMAVVTEAFNQRRLVVYDTATGKPLADSPVTIKNVFHPVRVAWSVDGKGVLLNGEGIADPETGKVVYEFPGGTHGTRLAVTLGSGIVWDTSDRNARKLVAVGLDAKQTAAAKAAVASGGTAADAMLPPLTRATLDTATATRPPAVGVPWKGQPDPAPPTSAVAQPVQMDFALTNARVFYTTPGAKAVGLFELMTNGPEPGKARLVRRVDLANGRTTAKLDLPPTVQVEDVTADGATALTVDYATFHRVDLFPLDGGKPSGFKPYESQPADAQKIVVNRFAGPDRLVTVNERGLVVVWSLPDFKQVAAADLPNTKAWALSPNKRYLAGIQNGAVRVIDLTTGAGAGDLLPSFTPQATPFNSFIAFRADGREVLAGFQNSSGPVLTRWDTATGRIRHEAPYAGTLGDPVKGYLGDNFLLGNFGTVYDLDRQATVWTLAGGTMAGSRADDRAWYAVNGPAQNSFLGAAKFPTDEIERTIAEIADGPGAVLKPGTRVGLTLQVEGGMAQTYRPKVSEALKAGFRQRELELVAKGAEVEVAVTVSERDTGEKISFRSFGRPGGDSVSVLELTAETTVSVNGESLWSPDGAKYRTNGGFVTLQNGEDLSEHLYKQMWNGVLGWSQGGVLPRYIAKTPTGVQALPQVSLLTANGIETTRLQGMPRRRK